MSRSRASLFLALMLILGVGGFVGCKPSSPSGDSTTTSSPEETTTAEPADEAVESATEDSTTAVEEPLPVEPETEVAQTLMIGDPAPSLSLAQWIKGDPVAAFADGQVYVVEFWATWCPPCRVSMPHISSLQEQYPNEVTFIGVSDEDEATVREFMASQQSEETGKTWDDVVTYAIALDANDQTGQAYMRAAGQNGIPTAFIVGKDGHIEWIGHPMSMDQTLEQVVSGEWDREAARKVFLARQELQDAYRAAQQTGDWTRPLQIVDELLAAQPEQPQMMRTKLSFLIAAKQYAEANVLADELFQLVQDNPMALNDLAWNLVTAVPPGQQNLELAMQIAKQASSLRQDQDPSILDTVARVYYLQDDLEEAIAWQTKAVEVAAAGGMKQQLQKTLDTYKAELPSSAEEEAPEVDDAEFDVDEEAEAMEAEEAVEEPAVDEVEDVDVEDSGQEDAGADGEPSEEDEGPPAQ